MKVCSKCKQEKTLDQFGSDCSRSDGLSYWCKTCKIQYKTSYYKKNKEAISEQRKIYRRENREAIRDYGRRYDKANAKKVSRRNSLRRIKDPSYRLACNLRTRLWDVIKNNRKSGSAVNDLGCSVVFFKAYIESLWSEGMSWENYGNGREKWNVDHIKELSRFNLSNREQFLAACHYTNLRPMWQTENCSRSADARRNTNVSNG